MENVTYNNLVINNKLQELANINNLNDLVNYKYLNLYLIEYLLKEGIHTDNMDNILRHSSKWIKFYLKYDVVKPILNCYLKPLLDIVDGRLIIDVLLEKINDNDKIELLSNLKKYDYWELHNHEKEIIDLYKKHGINILPIFIDSPTILDARVGNQNKSNELINKFCEVFKDTNQYILSIYLHEFKRRISIDYENACLDIKKLIENKKRDKDFILQISNGTEGEYNREEHSITISPKREGVLTHELSHLIYDQFDNIRNEELLEEYEEIRKNINKEETILRIVSYLKTFHERFKYMKKYFEKVYYTRIEKKYGNFNNYIKVVCEDVYKSNTHMIAVDDECVYYYITDANIIDVVTELLIIEKNEFVNSCTCNYYSEELMLENLLDAILKGDIYEQKFDIICLSGHAALYFAENEDASFNECLADYTTIKNSKKKNRLLNDLEKLIGNELIVFLDDYLTKNRGMKHEL